ncbi:unnamed protein product [Pieris macdunnoughi]|uniref:Uncharacterized protein n=1 Tax=Pieris macdunnoughi TaxID=345717 RepID=A0A821MXS9_9NEOP|nr:unnamed protein product [Pieris macdunnoughi]
MASSLFNISRYSRFNLSESESDIEVFVKEYGYRIKRQLANELEGCRSQFPSFVERKVKSEELPWVEENFDRFFKDSPNEWLRNVNYLSEFGFITSMIYTQDGDFLLVGHSTGLVQKLRGRDFIKMTDHKDIIRDYVENIENYYENEKNPVIWYPMFYRRIVGRQNVSWVKENHEKFIRNTPNEILYNRWFGSEMGPITSLTFSRNGYYIIVGHASGAIQMRHGSTGVVLCTLRNIQFPPKPIYALEYSRFEERVCYAACTDGAVYRIDIPNLVASTEDPPQYCIRADPALEYLNTQYYGAPGISSAATPFITRMRVI